MEQDITINLSKIKSAISSTIENPQFVKLTENKGKLALNPDFYPDQFGVNGIVYKKIKNVSFEDGKSFALYKKEEIELTVEV